MYSPTTSVSTQDFTSANEALSQLRNLLRASTDNNQKKINAEKFFTILSQQGLTWFDVIRELVLNNPALQTNGDNLDNLTTLIQYRDVIDLCTIHFLVTSCQNPDVAGYNL